MSINYKVQYFNFNRNFHIYNTHIYDVYAPKIILNLSYYVCIQKKPLENKTLMPEEKPATKKRLSVKVIKKITILTNTNIIHILYKTFFLEEKRHY